MSLSIQSLKIILLACFLIQNSSCSKKSTSFYNATDPFIKTLKSSHAEIKVSTSNLLKQPSILQPSRLEFMENGNLFVIADDANKSIILMNKQGELISEVGKEGRGPQEFESIIQLHIGNDDRVYVLDMLLFRITVYELVENKLKYFETYVYENPPLHSLQDIYLTKSGNYGVYSLTEGFQTPENRFLLYKLDRNFRPTKKLIEMPGNERQKNATPDFVFYTPHELMSRTFWDLDGEWFYYGTTFQSSVKKYNLKTEKVKTIQILKSQDRIVNSSHVKFFKERYGNKEYEEYWSIIEDQNKLPLFSGLWVKNNIIIQRVFYPLEENGIMVYIDQDSEEVKYFQAPHEFGQLNILNNRIYGIDFRYDEGYKLLHINLNI